MLGLESLHDQLDGVNRHLERLNPGFGGDPIERVQKNLDDVRQHVEDRTLQRMLETVQHLDEEGLYAEIERAEEALRNHITSRKEAEDALRAEVERLAVDVAMMQKSAGKYWQEAESVQEVQDKESVRRHEGYNAAKRQVQVTKRNTEFARTVLAEAERHADRIGHYYEENRMLEERSEVLRDQWEVAVQEVNKTAKRVEDLDKEKTRLAGHHYEADNADEADKQLAKKFNAQVKAMVTEQQELQRELRKAEDAQELQRLMENERASSSKKRLSTSVLIEQIAELEESGDHIERRSQAQIEAMRINLERGGTQVLELEHSKRQADEWVKAMWSTICQQKRDQLLLHQRMKEEDLWTAHLQERTDALVEELRALEEKVREYEGPVGATEKERQVEDDMFQRLQKIRERRRGAQHLLAINLARRRPLMEALEDAEEDEQGLLERFKPIREMMRKM